MKIQHLLYTLFLPATVMGMQQDGNDLVKQGLYYLFDIERHYDAMGLPLFYEGDGSQERPVIDKNLYRKKSILMHPDKHPDEQEKYTVLFKAFKPAFDLLSDAKHKEEYDTFLRFIDTYTIGIKGVAVGITLYSCWLAYQWSKQNLGSSPKATLNKLQASMHTAVNRLLTISFDRYVTTQDDFSLAKQIDIQQLSKVVSQGLSEKLTATITKTDALAVKAYTKIAWEYYDCQDIDDLKSRDANLVEELLLSQKTIDEIVEECKKELGIESVYTSCMRLIKPLVGVSCLIGLGAGLMRYKQSQIKVFGGYLRPEVTIRI